VEGCFASVVYLKAILFKYVTPFNFRHLFINFKIRQHCLDSGGWTEYAVATQCHSQVCVTVLLSFLCLIHERNCAAYTVYTLIMSHVFTIPGLDVGFNIHFGLGNRSTA